MSIGETLAAAREEAGLSIEDVSAATRLRGTVIAAIERDDFAPCGGDFYARGHIRTIAGIVGADAAALVAAFDASHRSSDEPAPSKILEAERPRIRSERGRPNWAAAMAVALVVVVALGVFQLVRGGNDTGSRHVADNSPSATASPSATTEPTTRPTTEPSTEPSGPPVSSPGSGVVAEAPVTVRLRITSAKCWVRASDSSGTTLYEGVLNPGEDKTFTDSQQVTLKLGNAPAANLTVNGVDIGAPPSKNQVTTVTYGPGDPTQAQG